MTCAGATQAQSAAGAALWGQVNQKTRANRVANAFATPRQTHKETVRIFKEAAKKDESLKPLAILLALGWTARIKKFGKQFWRTMQSEHTIVSAILPASEDTAGDHVRDENVIQIFFTVMIGELCILCMLSDGSEVPIFSLTTLINGAITTFTLAFVAVWLKLSFRWGNRIRFRKTEKRPSLFARLRRAYFDHAERRMRRRERRREHRRRLEEERQERRQHATWDRKHGWVMPGTRPNIATLSVVPSASKRKDTNSPRAAAPAPASAPAAAQADEATVEVTSGMRKWIPMDPTLHLVRYTLAWMFNLGIFFMFCILALTYGVILGPPTFDLILIAWVMGLVFTWAVIEPSEVLGIVLFPSLAENECVMKIREKCKDYGIYG